MQVFIGILIAATGIGFASIMIGSKVRKEKTRDRFQVFGFSSLFTVLVLALAVLSASTCNEPLENYPDNRLGDEEGIHIR